MEVDGDYPEETTSDHVNQVCRHDILSLGKKRKFLAETKEQLSLQASKYIRCETLVEHDSFSKESLHAKVFYAHIRKEKASIEEFDEHTGAESVQDSNSTVGESFSQCSDIKSDGYAKANSYDASSSSSSHAGGAISCSHFYATNSTAMNCKGPGSDVFQGGGIREDNLDESEDGGICEDNHDELKGGGIHEDNLEEFGHCLGYLASACDIDSKPQTDEEIEEFLYLNGMVPKSYLLQSQGLTSEQESQSSAHKPTIDQEFEQCFSMLMM